jgi:hypothetical protein
LLIPAKNQDSRRRSGRHAGYACGTGAVRERRWVGREERTLRLESTLWPCPSSHAPMESKERAKPGTL